MENAWSADGRGHSRPTADRSARQVRTTILQPAGGDLVGAGATGSEQAEPGSGLPGEPVRPLDPARSDWRSASLLAVRPANTDGRWREVESAGGRDQSARPRPWSARPRLVAIWWLLARGGGLVESSGQAVAGARSARPGGLVPPPGRKASECVACSTQQFALPGLRPLGGRHSLAHFQPVRAGQDGVAGGWAVEWVSTSPPRSHYPAGWAPWLAQIGLGGVAGLVAPVRPRLLEPSSERLERA